MAATLTIGLVIEAMRKMVSLVIGTLASLSRKPKESNITSLPLRAINTTAPGSSLFFTPSLIRSEIRFRRVERKPTSSGDCTLGMPCAATGHATETASAAAAARRTIDIRIPPRIFGPTGPSAFARLHCQHAAQDNSCAPYKASQTGFPPFAPFPPLIWLPLSAPFRQLELERRKWSRSDSTAGIRAQSRIGCGTGGELPVAKTMPM